MVGFNDFNIQNKEPASNMEDSIITTEVASVSLKKGEHIFSITQQTKEKRKKFAFPPNVASSSTALRQLFSGLKTGRRRKKHRSFVEGLYTATGLPDASPKTVHIRQLTLTLSLT